MNIDLFLRYVLLADLLFVVSIVVALVVCLAIDGRRLGEGWRGGRKILRRHLSWSQWLSYRVLRTIWVRGSATGRWYKLWPTGSVTCGHRWYCVYLSRCEPSYARLPLGDQLLAIKLVLETNEPDFYRQTSNWNPYGRLQS